MLLFKVPSLVIGLSLLLVYSLADKKHLHKKAKQDLSMILYTGITFIFVTMIV